MELRHLRYFVAVGEEQHYGRGAKRLRVAQPALSRQIQDLEEEIGFKLFDRLSRGVKVSAAGKVGGYGHEYVAGVEGAAYGRQPVVGVDQVVGERWFICRQGCLVCFGRNV